MPAPAPDSDARHAPWLATAAILAAAVLWGTTGTAQALADTQLHPVAVGWSRLILGGSTLFLVSRLMPNGANGGRALATLTGAGRLRWLLLAAAATATYQATFFAGVSLAGVALGTMVAIGSSPVIAGVLGRVLLGEPIGRGWWAATALAIVGCGLILLPGGAEASIDPLGVAFSLVAGLAYAVFAVAMRRVLTGDTPFLIGPATVLTIGAVLLAPVAISLLASSGRLAELADARTLLALGWLGVGATAGAYGFFGWGIRRVSAATAGSLTLAEPLVAFMLGTVLLGERPPALALLGGALLVGSLAFLAAPQRKREVPTIAS